MTKTFALVSSMVCVTTFLTILGRKAMLYINRFRSGPLTKHCCTYRDERTKTNPLWKERHLKFNLLKKSLRRGFYEEEVFMKKRFLWRRGFYGEEVFMEDKINYK